MGGPGPGCPKARSPFYRSLCGVLWRSAEARMASFPVLVVDDGELEDVRDLLNGERIDFAHLRGSAAPSPLDPPTDLFITNARHARLAGKWPVTGHPDRRPLRVAVVDEDSELLRTQLRDLGFLYLVRRPIHPHALRLMLLRMLYRGEERRTEPRVAIGYEVQVRSRLRRKDAWLADLSRGGCLLLCDRPMNEGVPLSVVLPGSLDEHSDTLVLPGKVLRSTRLQRKTGSNYQVAIRFAPLAITERDRLETALAAAMLQESKEEEAVGETVVPGDSPFESKEDLPTLIPEPLERREEPRGQYSKRVIASVRDAMHRILIGRDLSASGMRIEAHEDVAFGDRLRVAIYDASRSTPLVVEAIVERDDGLHGLALRFDGIDASLAQQLESLVASLPPVECLADGETGAMGTVVSEILPGAD